MAEYSVVLLGLNGEEIVNDPMDGMARARRRAKYLLSDDFVRDVEGAPGNGVGISKVEIRAQDGECLWDAFPKGRRPNKIDDDSPDNLDDDHSAPRP